MQKTNFETLQIYQLSETLADFVWGVVASWNYFAKDTVGKQFVRAADSIGANIAEGDGKGTFQDYRRFVRTARGSLNETKHWMRRATARDLLTNEQINELENLLKELHPKLNSYLRWLTLQINSQNS